MSSRARDRLIEIQRRMVEDAKTEIFEALGPMSPALREYYERYQSTLPGRARPVPRATVIEAVGAAKIAYFGDYHTLRESQKAPLRILEAVRREGRSLILATEVIRIDDQEALDRHLAGDLSEAELLAEIEYDRTWGFSWRNYALQFAWAREHGIPMLALNSDPDVVRDTLGTRDAIAAMRIAEAHERDPDALIAVLFGDLHVAPAHLPRRVDEFLSARGLEGGASVIVMQNAESVYWHLAERELEQATQAVEVDDGIYCLVNSTPLVKFQSYLNWEMNLDELEESRGLDEPEISSSVMTDQVHEIVRTICRFFELPEEGLEDFTVHTNRDLDFLDRLERSGLIEPGDLAEFRAQVEEDESFFLVDGRLIYLGNLSIDHAAEEATHYINTKLAGHVRTPPDPVFDFYYRTLKEAIGFLGSKIIHHKRSCYHRAEFEGLVEETRGRRLDERMTQIRQVARDVLTHLDYEDRYLHAGVRGYPRFRSLYRRDLPVHIGTTHSLGYILGDQLHAALMEGRVRRSDVRMLFEERFEGGGGPREVYFDWIEYARRPGSSPP